ncbi:MAG TPA: NADH-quinone oxidoreductase subunit C [Solirubrobacteraceae bacterium]|nr:NADH-quinone oxidoreductase subunit C [Solirubrobacteraceae bacterium]
MIALEDREVDAGSLATELVRLGGRLMMLFASASADGGHDLCAFVRAHDAHGGVIRLRAPVPGSTYPSVTPCVPAAHWFEREVHDLHGITPEGHPRLEPLVNHAPDEGEVKLFQEDDAGVTHRGAERLAGPGVFVIPYGPVRSGVFESAQFLVQTGGEDVAYCAQRLFFKRRGAERRICEVPLELAVLVAERVSGTSTVAHALAFSHAVESLADTEVPPRAQAIRRVLAELERLYNHLEATVRECEDASLAVAQAQFAALKERLHRIAAAVAGNRYLRGTVVPGGTRIDLDAAAVGLIAATMSEWEREWGRVLALLLRTDSFLDRLVSTGPLSEEDARDFACVGPVARASGIDLDTRRDLPYDGYPALAVGHHTDGDAMARMEVRFQEVGSAVELIREAVGSLAPGPTHVAIGPLVHEAALGAAESARGETLYWLEADGSESLSQCKLRAASFVNFGAFNRVFDAQVLTDFSFIEHSLGLSPAGCDA